MKPLNHVRRNWKKYAVLGAGLAAASYGVDGETIEQAKTALDAVRVLLGQ